MRVMSFSDSDWTRDPPPRPRMSASQRRVLILTIAIAVSCMALAVAVYGIEQLLDASARGDEIKRIGDVAAVSPPSAGVVAPPAVASAVDAAPLAAAAASATPAEANAQQLSALEAEMRQRARETAEQATAEAARRKERAWQRFYQRPDFCADNPTAAQMVQCANQYIRARKEFEERYGAGRL
jgi:Zn-dependent M32 family carboxypeptidase